MDYIRIIFFCFLLAELLVPSNAQAAVYYVDAIDGNDSHSGLSAEAAWKTIAKVNAGVFRAGDSILFKAGDRWQEELDIRNSGMAGNPITFGSYGVGAKPVISGADLVKSGLWSNYKSNIYVTNIGPLTTIPNQVYVDGVFHELARYPASSYLTVTASTGTQTQIIDTKLTLAASDIVGSTLVARSSNFSGNAASVTAYDVNTHTITLGENLSYPVPAGYGFYFRNMLWMLTVPRQWFYDQVTGQLYLWPVGNDNPFLHRVEISNRPYGINISGSYINLVHLEIRYPQLSGIYGHNDSNIAVSGITIYGSTTGIDLKNCVNCSVQDSLIEGTLAGGIRIVGNDNLVSGNVINNSGNVLIADDSSEPTGILMNGNGNLINKNAVTNNGFAGILSVNGASVIENNSVNQSCLKFNDCGGIYTWAGYNVASVAGTRISGNRITNTIGNLDGTPSGSQTQGIYLDNKSEGVILQNNYISNADHGIFIHDGRNNIVTGNRIFDGRGGGLWIEEDSDDNTPSGFVQNNLVLGNVFESTSSEIGAAYYLSRTTGDTNYGIYNNNIYCHPHIVAVVTRVVPSMIRNYNLAAWQQTFLQDLDSTETPAYCPYAEPPSITPVVMMKSSSSIVPYGGEITISWTTMLADTCVSGGGLAGTSVIAGGYKQPSYGGITVRGLTSDTTYTLSCTGIGGTITRSVTVNVERFRKLPFPKPPFPKLPPVGRDDRD